MQDGIVKRLLDETCPQSGLQALRLQEIGCKTRANAWLWGPTAVSRPGRLSGRPQAEDSRIIVDSLKRYPLMQLRAALYRFGAAILHFKTGDGIEPQEWILKPEFQRMMPAPASRLSGGPPAARADSASRPST